MSHLYFLNFTMRPVRLHHFISIVFVTTVFGLLWKTVEVVIEHSNKDYIEDTISFESALYQKSPAKIITDNKLQDNHLAKAVQNSMQDRLELINKKCQEGWKPQNDTLFKKLNLFFFDTRRKLGYCHVAKAGCTFWLRIFTYLTRRKELKYFGISSPFMIQRIHLHTGSLSPIMSNHWPHFEDEIFRHSFRFFFARNPYARLLSVYFDKYYLLGHSLTRFIPDLTCDYSKAITFKHFINFALDSSDHHLLPISDLCNPCVFKPHAIGKMETFKPDAQFILDKANYGSILRHYNHSYRVELELESVVNENFEYLANIQARYGEDCLSAKSLSNRIWNVFMYNGYIPRNLTLQDEGISFTKYGFLMYIKKIVSEYAMSEDQTMQQQKQYLFEFYSKIGVEKIRKLQQRYLGDFELFGYSKDVPKNTTS